MWIASKLGFFSIVQKADGFHVRARIRPDLERLLAVGSLTVPIQEWPAADYRWRAIVTPGELHALFAALEGSVDYPDFKSEVARHADQREKLTAYHELWAGLYSLQHRPPSAPRGS